MNAHAMKTYLSVFTGIFAVLIAGPAQAYLGPGAGLGMIGSLIAVVLVALVVVFGLVIYPIRMMRKKRNAEKESAGE